MKRDLGQYDFTHITSGCRAEVGDIVICISDRLKLFDKDEKYEVDDIQEWDEPIPVKVNKTRKIKLKGFSGFYDVRNFNMLSGKELRAEKLRKIEGDSPNIVISPRKIRKINTINKKKQLFKIVCSQIVRNTKKEDYDPFKGNLQDLIKQIVKDDRTFETQEIDFDDILNMKLKDILDIYTSK